MQLQAYGLLIVTLAIAFPNIAYTANASAPSESLKIVYSSGMPRKSSIKIAAATLVLAYLTSTTTSHCPSSVLAPAFPSFSTNSTGYSNILEARKSVTGWIVVGEQDVKGHRMRYMRADHSLLGGLWVGPARKAVIEAMLEAKVSLWAKVNEDEVVGTADSIYVSPTAVAPVDAGTDVYRAVNVHPARARTTRSSSREEAGSRIDDVSRLDRLENAPTDNSTTAGWELVSLHEVCTRWASI